ncbi:hypothetical protein CBS147323_4248 [Aspergillus niger]|nr:hypothetical protein CBS147323_4248 [Aspergillus niger]
MQSSSTVTVLTTHKVQCADRGSLAQIACPFPLGPFDHLLPPFAAIAVVFVWRQPREASFPMISFNLLHTALARLLDFYPHLTGRVNINDKDKTPEIRQLGEGAELHSAVCETALPQCMAPEDMPGQGNALLAKFNSSPECFSNEPILSIQHTRFRCGSVSLGVRVNHTVCDAHGFVQLMEDLAEIYRRLHAERLGAMSIPLQKVQAQQQPCITSYLSDVVLSPQEASKALKVQPVDYHVQPAPTVMTFKSNKPITGKLLQFTRDQLCAIKKAATDPTRGQYVSTFEALTAHLWLSIQRARTQCGPSKATIDCCDETADLLTSIDWRSPSRLNLPPRYFPNAVSEPYITLPLNNISSNALPQTAQIIHETLKARSPADQHKTLQWVKAQPNKSKISLRARLNEKGFIISQWNKLNMYAIHFDNDNQGNRILPDRIWPPFTENSLVDGLAYLLPTKPVASTDDFNRHSDIEVALSLHEPLWDVLGNDTQFTQFLKS